MKKVSGILMRAAAAAAAASLLACTSAKVVESHVDAAALATSVKSKLSKDARLANATNVDVNPRTGVVTLSGRVSSREDRVSAGRLACSASGVTFVYNELDVAPAER